MIHHMKNNYSKVFLFGWVVLLALFVLFCLPAVHSHADIFKYVDEDGVIHLTNVPSNPKAKYVLIMKEKRLSLIHISEPTRPY